MSHKISKLLGQPKTSVELVLNKLENLSGFDSQDVRLLAEMATVVRKKITELGLDPDDTTQEELYHCLRVKARHDSQSLAKRLNLADSKNDDDFVMRFIDFAQHSSIHPEVWGLKRNVAKTLLKSHQPKRLMKFLGYRSIDSLLKREDVAEIFIGAMDIESDRWRNSIRRDIAGLSLADFEDRRTEVVVMRSDRWRNHRSQARQVESVPVFGAVAVWCKDAASCDALAIGLEFFEAVASLKIESSFLKLKQFEGGFGERLLQVASHDLEASSYLAHLPVDWKSITRHFAVADSDVHSASFPPHIQHEDVHWHAAVEALAELDPALRWWRNLSHIGSYKDGQVVSLNLADVTSDYLNDSAFHQRSASQLHTNLWHEIIERYLGYDAVKAQLLSGIERAPSFAETLGLHTLVPQETAIAKELEAWS